MGSLERKGSMKQIRIVLSDTTPLWPPRWGGPKRMWELYHNLPEQRFHIDYVGLDIHQEEPYKVYKRAENIRELLASLPKHYALWKPIHERFFKYLSFDLFYYFLMPTVRQFTRIFQSLPGDVLISSHPWSSTCMKPRPGQIFIYDSHNCEYRLMKRLTKRGLMGSLICRWAKWIEKEACRKSEVIFVCSQEEKEQFMEIYGIEPERIYIIPNGSIVEDLPTPKETESARSELGFAEEKIVLFIAAFFKPNNDAAEFIVNTLARELPEYTFCIVGSVYDAFRDHEIPPNVRFSGMVDEEDLERYLRAADMAINFMFDGSGTNIKMLDYLGHGLPTIVSEVGNRGLRTEHKRHVYVASQEGVAAGIREVYEDAELKARLRTEGHALAKADFDWREISTTVGDLLSTLMERPDEAA